MCALRSAPLVPLPAGVAGPRNGEAAPRQGSVTVQPQRARTARGLRGRSAVAGPGLGVRAPGAASLFPPRPPSHLPSCGQVCGGRWVGTPGASSSDPAWDTCGTRSFSASPRGGAVRARGPGVCPAGWEAAPFVRVTEPCLRTVQLPRRRRRGTGCDHLGGRRPLPRWRGGISLKEAGTSLFPDRRCRESGAPCPARGGRRGGPHTWPLPPAQALRGGGPSGESGSSPRVVTGGDPRRPGPGWTAKAAVLSGRDGQRCVRSRHSVA